MPPFINYLIIVSANKVRIEVWKSIATAPLSRFSELVPVVVTRSPYVLFADRYFFHNLIHWERFSCIEHSIEKEIKKWRREKKEKLIAGFRGVKTKKTIVR